MVLRTVCGFLGSFFSLDTINSQHNCEHLSSYERTFTFFDTRQCNISH